MQGVLWLLPVALAAPQERPNVVLITIDTTRVDAVSCYADPVGPFRAETRTTPVIDALAAEGVRLERFYTHAPTTLSAHTSLLTGLDPHQHGVPRNGFPVDPAHRSVAQELAEAGWDTVAVVGSAALEQAMGLDRGFAVYDDAMPGIRGIMYQDDADGVVRRTLAHVDERDPDAPLFLWVHFYDPHTPYVPPAAFHHVVDPTWRGSAPVEGDAFRAHSRAVRSGTADPRVAQRVSELYLAEVAYVDDRVGVLLDGLEARGVLDTALVVVTADHGESLPDAGDYTYSHGSDVAVEVMHVPLVARGYGLPVARGAVVRTQATASGLAATLLEAAGLGDRLGGGRSFWGLLRDGPLRDDVGWPERPVRLGFVEATRPRAVEHDSGWNNQHMHRGVFAAGVAVARAPFQDEPWHLQAPSAPAGPAAVELLGSVVDRWDADLPPHAVGGEWAPATLRALEALGYLEPGEEP